MVFQFHKGAIETTNKEANRYDELTFNSIKVRLKHFRAKSIQNVKLLSIP